jgi:hypothetical protein
MSRLSLQVFYLWRHVLSTAPPFIIWWSNLEILFAPLHCSAPFIGTLRCQSTQTEHGPYIAEWIQKAVYIVICLWISTRTMEATHWTGFAAQICFCFCLAGGIKCKNSSFWFHRIWRVERWVSFVVRIRSECIFFVASIACSPFEFFCNFGWFFEN